VRGPIRSRTTEDIREEVRRLAAAGFREVVLTGIHLSSYGKDFTPASSLLDAVRAVGETEEILRIRLGSLEPMIATEAFAAELGKMEKICPQFHLALQSGSDTVLARMKRQYNTAQYMRAVENLRLVFPQAAFTTDILTGFPGESEEEFAETVEMIRKVGFARIHVFPYSARPDTPAAVMPGQLSAAVKEERARKLIAIGNDVASGYLRSWIGRESVILPEEQVNGCWEGYTPEYIRVRMEPGSRCSSGIPAAIRLTAVDSRVMRGKII
jgi:threonylcarbamoyladenosine tRNA methylthiotransferase MtaB